MPREVLVLRERSESNLERCPARFWRFGDAPKAIWSDAQRGLGVSGALRKQFGAMPSEVWACRERSEINWERCPARFGRFGSALKSIWSDAQRGFGVSGALRNQFGAMPSEVLASRERAEGNLERCPAMFWRFGGASKAIWSDAQRCFGVSGRFESNLERCPARFWRSRDASKAIWSDAQRCFGASGRLESILERCPARFWRIGSVSKAYECKTALTPGVRPILNRISVSTRMCVQGGSQSIETALTPSVRVTLGSLSIRTPRRGQGRTKNTKTAPTPSVRSILGRISVPTPRKGHGWCVVGGGWWMVVVCGWLWWRPENLICKT